MDTKELVRIRNGAAIPELHFFGKRCKEDGPPAIAAASAGDGRALATLLTRCTLSWTDYDRIVALLPRIQQGRDELGKYFALFRESHATYAYRPFHWVEYAARQRDLARLLGNASEAARWQRIVDNYLDVFSDRRRVVALYLWTSDEV